MARVAPMTDEWHDALETPDAAQTSPGMNLEEWLAKQRVHAPRLSLPMPQQNRPNTISLVQLVKDTIGKHNLSRIPTPVQFHEPITELQQRAEDLQFTELLDKARTLPTGSLERLAHVAAYSMTAYSGLYRDNKPFFSLMGETYEFVCPEKGIRMISEKVQHEPMAIGHSFCEGRGWTWELEDELRMRFTGTTIELVPAVLMKVTFDDGESYEYHKAVTSINNLICGKMYVDHKGTWMVTNCGTGMVAHMTFLPPSSMLSRVKRDRRHVEGHFEQNGTKLETAVLVGKCDEALFLERPGGQRECLWKAGSPPKDPTRFNFMSSWPFGLNQLPDELAEILPPTDARFRIDVRLLEEGIYDKAQAEKVRLEKKQDALHLRGGAPQPLWFEPVPGVTGCSIGKKFLFKYKGGYWEARDGGRLKDIADPWA